MARLSRTDRTQLLEDATAQFWKHIIPIVQIAFAIHAALFALFVALDIRALAVANAASLVVYQLCLKSIKHERFGLAGLMMCSEIIAHAVLATWILGWESNFHFYVFCIVPIAAFSFQNARLRYNLFNAAILASAVGLFALRDRMGQQPSVSAPLLNLFGIINVLVATAILLHATRLSVRYTLSMQYNLFDSANRDTLTQLYTRRRIQDRVRQLARLPHPVPIALVLLDIDHFKQINDHHGHDQGDIILQRVAGAISRNVRALDLGSRWGGEEFLVLMPQTRLEEALAVAERILAALRESAALDQPDALPVTATLAVAELGPGEAFSQALARADQALYQGKQAGRNRVMVAQHAV